MSSSTDCFISLKPTKSSILGAGFSHPIKMNASAILRLSLTIPGRASVRKIRIKQQHTESDENNNNNVYMYKETISNDQPHFSTCVQERQEVGLSAATDEWPLIDEDGNPARPTERSVVCRSAAKQTGGSSSHSCRRSRRPTAAEATMCSTR